MPIPSRECNTLSLWLASPDELLSGDNLKECWSILSVEEQSRAERYVNERDRRAFLAAHALVRIALSYFHPLALEAWRFSANSYGKPEVIQECGLQFNLAHSAKLVACLVSYGVAVGVDVEPNESARAIIEIASEVFSSIELSQLQALPARERLDRALSLWALKEAYVKARGTGFSLNLKKFSFAFGEDKRLTLESDQSGARDGMHWWSCIFEHREHRIGLVTNQTPEPLLQICEIRSLQDIPIWRKALEKQWFPSSTGSH
jgi:4'-phosphopantetheinyl transferase